MDAVNKSDSIIDFKTSDVNMYFASGTSIYAGGAGGSGTVVFIGGTHTIWKQVYRSKGKGRGKRIKWVLK